MKLNNSCLTNARACSRFYEYDVADYSLLTATLTKVPRTAVRLRRASTYQEIISFHGCYDQSMRVI